MKVRSVFLVTFLTTVLSFTNGNCQLNNTSYGTDANPSNNGNHNSAFGKNTLKNVSSAPDGSYNSAFGSATMLNNTTGLNNSAFGASTLMLNTTGSNNVAFGRSALEKNLTGNYNIAVGFRSLFNFSTGSGNTVLGNQAGSGLLSGSNNIFIGSNSGTLLNSGNNNVFIGRVRFSSGSENINDRIIIATGAVGNNENGVQRIYINENGYMGLGLGNHVIPQNRLEIASGLVNTAGLRFRGINSSSATQTSNGKVLSVNANGDVILVPDQVGTGGGVSNTITAGNNISVNLTGTNYTISSDYENIYTHDGALSEDRTMDMADYNLHFNTSNSPSNGKIYIGDTPDYPTATGEYKLYVEGGILTEKVKVALRSTANWADYIFADDYQLKPLKEVEEFIKANNHLPGIESAQELVEKGLDLGEMQAKQMGKIEELTLYIIEQDKKIEQQKHIADDLTTHIAEQNKVMDQLSKEIKDLKVLVKALTEKE